jgi:Gram-negative porin
VTTRSSVIRRGVLCSFTLGALLLAARPASADLTLAEGDGWTFFTDGRVNSFLSLGWGDDFPKRNMADPTMLADPVGGGGQYFTAGFPNDQGYNKKYFGTRVRSGFLGSIIAFGVKRQVTEWTSVKSYISLWGTSETFARDRANDAGLSTSKGFDMREGWIGLDGLWGSFVAGRQSGILGGISTEIDFLYGHNFGVGLPCLEIYYPTCGHIGTGALGPGFASGFSYTTPSLSGLKVKVGLYDPVRLLGVWERVPYPRPEGSIAFERRISPGLMFKLQAEGMIQYMGQIAEALVGDPNQGPLYSSTEVWGVAGGGRLEAGPFRLGLSAFRGKGLGAYVALQNASSTFNGGTREFRYFTGLYAQTAVVFGREQVSAGIGRVQDDLLPSDRIDIYTSNLKYQTGISAAFYHRLTDNLVLGIDYFFFRTDWWGAPAFVLDASGAAVVAPGGGLLPGEKQVIQLVNVGATFHW